MSSALVYAVSGDADIGRYAVEIALRVAARGIRTGHETFGCDLALGAVAYDLCHPLWNDAERVVFHDYVNRTVDANHESERSPFHNGFYSYKYWGIGMAGLATWGENPRAADILDLVDADIRAYVVPAFRMAGDGGAWAEGYYVHYWLYRWLFFYEAARRCAGVDYYALSPEFLSQRAIAEMFESLPGMNERGLPAMVPSGDSGGGRFTWERDQALASRRILASYYRDDPGHQAVAGFNRRFESCGYPANAYKDFLWRDDDVPASDLDRHRLSHVSLGAGRAISRSSWADDATVLFFSCGPRFTAHQHLDAGHFSIYKRGELAGDGGQFYSFATPHEAGYLLRSIAHSTMLVYDPNERWPDIRLSGVHGNDGGQHHNWPHHNGSVTTPAEWEANRELYDVARIIAFQDTGDVVYTAGDASDAYDSRKLASFVRQILFIRPATFVICDRVTSTDPSFRKTWLLQASRTPTRRDPFLVIDNGCARLYVQTLLPKTAETRLCDGEALYAYDGHCYPPDHEPRQAPECRIEISPVHASLSDTFLTVLTTADREEETPVPASASAEGDDIVVTLPMGRAMFEVSSTGGWVELESEPRRAFPKTIHPSR